MLLSHTHITVTGLGYVDLPLATESGQHHVATSFDTNPSHVAALRAPEHHRLEMRQEASNQINSVVLGDQTTRNEPFMFTRINLTSHGLSADTQPVYRDFRAGDVRRSLGKLCRTLARNDK